MRSMISPTRSSRSASLSVGLGFLVRGVTGDRRAAAGAGDDAEAEGTADHARAAAHLKAATR
jgi:hypothetical protein